MVSIGEKFGILRKPEWEIVTVSCGMNMTRTSIFSGQRNTMFIPISREEFVGWREGGKLAQEAFPDLSTDEREFLISGATPEEWAGIFGPEKENA